MSQELKGRKLIRRSDEVSACSYCMRYYATAKIEDHKMTCRAGAKA